MPKRLQPDERAAALAAGAPPHSEDYPDDDDSWHAAQDDWLDRWQPGVRLPVVGDKKRRTEWNAHTKKHNRHFVAGRKQDETLVPHTIVNTAGSSTAAPCDVAEAHSVPAYSRSWELSMLRAMCLGRGVEYSVSDSNEDLLSRLAAGTPPADPSPSADQLPAAAPADRHEELLPILSISELRRQCRVRGVEYSISDTSVQLVEKLAAASPAA